MRDGKVFKRGTRLPVPGDLVMVYKQVGVDHQGSRRRWNKKLEWTNEPGIFVRFRSHIFGSIDGPSRLDDLGIDLESPLKGKFHVLLGRDLVLRYTEDLLSDVMVISGINDE